MANFVFQVPSFAEVRCDLPLLRGWSLFITVDSYLHGMRLQIDRYTVVKREPLTRDRVPTQFHNMIWGPSPIMENPKITASLYCLCVLEYRHNGLKGFAGIDYIAILLAL